MRKVRTLHDATRERLAAKYDPTEAAALRQEQSDRADAAALARNPRIGMLIRNGRRVYYATIAGTYVESSEPQALASQCEDAI